MHLNYTKKNYQNSKVRSAIPALLLSFFTASCGFSGSGAVPPDVSLIASGVWESDGYGHLVSISDSKLKFYNYTPDFCIENKMAGVALSQQLIINNIAVNNDDESMSFSTDRDPHPITFHRITNIPSICLEKKEKTPEDIFAAFNSYMRTHYAFFDLYGVDWNARVLSYQESVGNEMSEAQLFDLICEMIEPLKDAHLGLEGSVGRSEKSCHAGQSSIGDAIEKMAGGNEKQEAELNRKLLQSYWEDGISKILLGDKGVMTANGAIQYGLVQDDIGYVAILMEDGYSGQGDNHEADDLNILTSTLDDALQLFNGESVKTVIIDLSVNFGGQDFFGREIAARFHSDRRLAYTKYAADAENTSPFAYYIEPYEGEVFNGPVVLVTSEVTMSAGETLSLALRASPSVTHIGEPTRGALSDILYKNLPNGWTLTLSNEVYRDHEGELWEDRGIEPDIPFEIFNRRSPFDSHHKAIAEIISLIENETLNEAANGAPAHD